MNIRSKNASLMVETAIFLPVFIIALLTIAHLVRVVQVQETTMHVLSMEARKWMVEEFVSCTESEESKSLGPKQVMMPDLIREGSFYLKSKAAMEMELGKWIHGIRIDDFQRRGNDVGLDSLCSATLSCDIALPVINLFHQDMTVKEHVSCRAFVGQQEKTTSVFSFADMEKEEKTHTVYVFPRSGERYHGKNCRLIKTIPNRVILTTYMKTAKNSCKLCQSKKLSIGTPVLHFMSAEGAYHRADCTIVNRYVTSMEWEQAEEKGYTPCRLCGGGA